MVLARDGLFSPLGVAAPKIHGASPQMGGRTLRPGRRERLGAAGSLQWEKANCRWRAKGATRRGLFGYPVRVAPCDRGPSLCCNCQWRQMLLKAISIIGLGQSGTLGVAPFCGWLRRANGAIVWEFVKLTTRRRWDRKNAKRQAPFC